MIAIFRNLYIMLTSYLGRNTMKTTPCIIIIAGFALAAAVPRVSAQEYFNRIDTPEDLAPVTPTSAPNEAETNPAESVNFSNLGVPNQPAGEEKYNMALGGLHFGLAAGVGLEYNDNINLAPSGQRLSDWAFRPSVTVDSTYAFSELNTLRFSLGASYAKYFRYSQFDTRGVLISPNSILALTMHVGQVAITFRDRFSYQEDPFDEPTISNTAVYRRFENQVGIQADWAINEMLDLTGGYDHYNLWTIDNQFSSLERAIDTVFIKPSYQIAPAVKVGVDASASFVRFNQQIQNNGDNYMIGPFVDVALARSTHLYAEGGYQDFVFQHDGTTGDNSDAKTWYARVDLANRLSDAFTQHLLFTKSAEIGFGSNFYDLYHVEYAADWKITESLSLDPSLFYEHYTTSAPVGTVGEKADRYGAAIGLRYIFTPSITLGLDYRYVYKDSNLPGLDYRQNLVLLSLYYNF